MYSYSLDRWVLFFLFYCLAGWCIESTYVSIKSRRFVNRGFLKGPVIPIYGFGAIVTLFATLPVRSNLVAVFFLGMLAATLLEYITGAIMEALFQVRYWDYTDNRFNLNGYICLGTSLSWGVLSVVLIRWLHSPAERLILALPSKASHILAVVLLGLFMADVIASTKTALDLRHLLEQLAAYSDKAKEDVRLLQKRMEIYSTVKRENLAEFLAQKLPDGGEALQKRIEAMEQAAERLEQSETVQKLRTDLAEWRARRTVARENLRQRLTWDKRLVLHSNPSARSKRYAEQLKLLRQRITEEKQEKQEKQKRQ